MPGHQECDKCDFTCRSFNDMLSHYNKEHGKGEHSQEQVQIETTDDEVELEPTAEDVKITSEEPPVKSYSPVKAPENNEVITYVNYLGFQEICALPA